MRQPDTAAVDPRTSRRRLRTSEAGAAAAYKTTVGEIYLSCNENVLRDYPRHALATYYFLKARFPNGRIYAGFRAEVARRTGWKARSFFGKTARLCKLGLARREGDALVLLPFRELIAGSNGGRRVGHKCTLRCGGSEAGIRHAILLKLFEEKHRQVRHASNKVRAATGIKGHADERASSRGSVPRYRERSDRHMVKAAGSGFEAMSVPAVARHMGVSASTVKRWKRASLEAGEISARRRVSVLPRNIATYGGLKNADLLGRALGGTVFKATTGWVLRRSTMYRIEASY